MNGQADLRHVRPGEYPPVCPVNSNTFPGKLWKLVTDEQFPSIRWTNDGTCIGIDAHKFKYEVLAREDMAIFKTKNFSSFVRQLNLYGFRKITALHQGPRIYDFSQSHVHSHPQAQQQLNSNLQHFQHEYFNRSHPEHLIRVRRASAAQKRKAQEDAEALRGGKYLFPPGLGLPSSADRFGILSDRTNLYNNNSYQFGGKAFPVSLIANRGSVFGLSLIASASQGSLVATPATGQNFDFSKLCNEKGKLRKYVVIGRQDAQHGAGPMLFNDTDHGSPTPPVLKGYNNMSPMGNPHASVGYALTEAPLDTSLNEAESAVSFLLNESFESSQPESPEPPLLWSQQEQSQQTLPSDPETDSQSTGQLLSSSASGPSSSDNSKFPSEPSSSSISGTSGSSLFASSDPPSFYHTSSSSSFNSSRSFASSGFSRPSGSFSSSNTSGFSRPSSFSSSTSSAPSFTSSFGSSRSGSSLLPPPMPPANQGKDIISSAFMNATQEQLFPQRTLSQDSSMMMDFQTPLMEDSEQLAVPLAPSPVEFATGLMQAPSSTPIVNMGRKVCSVPNCQCHLAPRPPTFPTSQPMPLYNMQALPVPVPMKLEPC